MNDMSWQLPNRPLRGRALATGALGAAVTFAVAATLATALHLTAAYPAKAVAVFAGIAAIALSHLRHHHPFDAFGPANHVTTARAALVSLVAAMIGEPAAPESAAASAAAAVAATALDGVDGWLARRSRMVSAFGARYDMEIDALLIMVLAVLAWQFGKAGVWIVLAGLMRYAFLAAGYAWRWLDGPLPPSARRKAVCVIQIVGLAAVVSPAVSGTAGVIVAAGTLAALTYSFAVDVLWLRRYGA